MLHVWYMYLHLGDFGGNVNQYSIHGAYGNYKPTNITEGKHSGWNWTWSQNMCCDHSLVKFLFKIYPSTGDHSPIYIYIYICIYIYTYVYIYIYSQLHCNSLIPTCVSWFSMIFISTPWTTCLGTLSSWSRAVFSRWSLWESKFCPKDSTASASRSFHGDDRGDRGITIWGVP